MSESDARPRRRRPLPGFPQRLARALSKSSLTDAEVSRLTGIARNVLSGYKKGSTFPGVAEIHSLCKTLEISADELIFGTEHPFKVDPLRERLGLKSDTRAAAAMMVFVSLLAPSERNAVLAIVHALLEAKHGREKVKEADAAIGIVAELIGNIAPELETAVEQMVTPLQIKEAEKRLAERFPTDRQKSPSTRRRR